MKSTMIGFLAGVMLCVVGGLPLGAAADEPPSAAGHISVPWEEFKKLLHLEENEVLLSLETFQKLVAQTGAGTRPPHTVRDGNVVLTRAAFEELVNRMKPPVASGAEPPFEYLITKAIYAGAMGEQNTTFSGAFHVHVLRKKAYLKIPLLPQSIALEDVTIDGEPALVVSEDGYHRVVLSQEGEHDVVASFSLRSTLEEGPHKIDLPIQQTPITLLQLAIPLEDIDVEVPQAQQMVTEPRDKGTFVSAVITPGRTLSVRWRKRVSLPDELPPKLYGEAHHLVAIEDDALKISSGINCTILHSEIDNVRLAVPAGMNVLSIRGEGVGEWQEVEQGGDRLILVPFTYGRKGIVSLHVSAESPLSSEGRPTAFAGIRLLDTVRETGFIGIELKTSAEVRILESSGLEVVATQKLPEALYAQSVKPLVHGFKYLGHPFRLVLETRKHEKITVPAAAVGSASAVTLFTEDGKVVHRLVYQVKNSTKQFLEMRLPKEADVWSVFVDNEPVESAISADGKLLVPLVRSRVVGNRLEAFPVEVIYCRVGERFSPASVRNAHLPAVDLLTSQLLWSVYLPNDYSYFHFRSTLEKEEMIRGLNILGGAQRQYDKEELVVSLPPVGAIQTRGGGDRDRVRDAIEAKIHRSEFRNVAVGEDQLSDQRAAELEFSGRLDRLALDEPGRGTGSGHAVGSGVLPIHIQVPTGGQVYRFARTIVNPEDPLRMTVTFAQNWVLTLVKWVVVLAVVGLVLLNRTLLAGVLRKLWGGSSALGSWFRKHEAGIKRAAQSIMTPFVLLGVLVVSWPASGLITGVVFLLLWVSVVYQVARYRRKRMQARAAVGERVPDEG